MVLVTHNRFKLRYRRKPLICSGRKKMKFYWICLALVMCGSMYVRTCSGIGP